MHTSLAEAALSVSTDEYPELDVSGYLSRLDAYADVIRSRLPNAASAKQIIDAINRYLFKDLGYRGNIDDYYDPRNSYLNDVMDRRLGIPITLSLIFIEIAKRLGLKTQGVSFPGHFLVKCHLDKKGFLIIDPFVGGKILPRKELIAGCSP
jgi:regulator of sirC expression with transglutaminase-like and TPR domain